MTQTHEAKLSKLEVLADLERTISQRANDDQASSYTAQLLSQGPEKCAKKFGEEAVEVVLASLDRDEKHLIAEAADVLYHLLVLLKSRNIPLSAVMEELDRRTSQSGLQEKASRK
ncbi:Phosphoribosyl-ATP pyrophosphatase [hydrothermal vent metagenome]|uniref:phosphoribosyl-ATP diphosphatase n=1 Tax=hydrothermal vent metagenome TaxID=652676 RepID=A0A3B0RTF7_9ZZZZ